MTNFFASMINLKENHFYFEKIHIEEDKKCFII